MSDMFDALIGEQPVDTASLAAALRQKQQMGTVAALTGISGLQKLGPEMINDAASGAQDYATLRDRTANQGLQRALQAQQQQLSDQQHKDAVAAENARAKEHDETLRIIGAGHDKARAASGFGSLTDEENAALRDSVAAGKISPDRVNSRNIKFLAGMALNNPDADLNKLAGEAAQARNVPTINKSQTLEQLPGILQSVVDAGSALKFSDNRVLGSLQLLKAKYSNDPKYSDYMSLRNDSLMAIAGAMRGQGMSDFATKLEEEAQHPTQSPAALGGWLKGQMTALAPKLAQAHKVLRDTPPALPSTAASVAPPPPQAVAGALTPAEQAELDALRKRFKGAP